MPDSSIEFSTLLLKFSSPEVLFGSLSYLLHHFCSCLFLAHVFTPLFFTCLNMLHIVLFYIGSDNLWSLCRSDSPVLFLLVLAPSALISCVVRLFFTVSWINGPGILSVEFLWGPGWNAVALPVAWGNYQPETTSSSMLIWVSNLTGSLLSDWKSTWRPASVTKVNGRFFYLIVLDQGQNQDKQVFKW